MRNSFKVALGFAFALSLTPTSQAKITLPVDNSAEQFEIPRSQIRNYIQRGTIEENLKPIRQVRPQALGDEELLSIPSKYLPPDLRIKQNEIRRNQAQTQKGAPKKAGKVKSSEFVTIGKQGGSGTKKLKLEETIWAADGKGQSNAVLLPQRRLPSVEVLEFEKVEAGKKVVVELDPGERREILALFKNGNSTDKEKLPLMDAFHAYNEKDYASSTTLAFGVLSNKKLSNSHETARYLLAHSLFQAGFYASALTQLIPLVTSKLRRSALGMSAKAIEKTRDDAAANQILSKVSLAQIPKAFQGTYAFHLGRVLLQTGAGKAALTAFEKVGENNPRHAEAQYFSGVIVASEISPQTSTEEWSREGSRVFQARAFFEESHRRAQNSGAKDLQALSHLALGRLAYQLKQFNQAVYHYGEIPNTSPFAKEAGFETAWALYRLGEFNRALGRLHPMGSPYFEARDLAELWILRSLNYLKLCRFDEANTAANTFRATANKVVPEIDQAVKVLSSAKKLEQVSEFETLEMSDWIKTALFQDPVIIKDKTNENLLRKEAAALDILKKNLIVENETLREDTVDTLKAILTKKQAAIGRAIKPYLVERLRGVASDYRGQMGKLDFLKFEIYSQATKFPDALKRPQAKRLIAEAEFLPGVFLKGNEILWRFNGEYWIDEVAGYDYFIPTECSLEKKL